MKIVLNVFLMTILLMTLTSCKEEEIDTQKQESPANQNTELIFDTVGDTKVVVIGNSASNFIVSFEHKRSDGETPNLQVLNGDLPNILRDDAGNLYNLFGEIVEGVDEGKYLLPVFSYQSYWFAIAAFVPGVEIYGLGGEEVNLDLRSNEEWSIPTSNLFVGTAFDAIPAIDEPKFALINNDGPNIDVTSIPAADDLVIGIIEDGQPKAYPHSILNWHEVVNEESQIGFKAITFCPLTGTAIGWEAESSFGVSGLLYNSNLIAYDRETESMWSQMLGSSIHGERINAELTTINLVETEWSTWSTMYPNTKLLTTETGFARDYDTTPYEGYMENNDLIYYPVDYNDTRLPAKQRVHVIKLNKNTKVYKFDDFD